MEAKASEHGKSRSPRCIPHTSIMQSHIKHLCKLGCDKTFTVCSLCRRSAITNMHSVNRIALMHLHFVCKHLQGCRLPCLDSIAYSSFLYQNTKTPTPCTLTSFLTPVRPYTVFGSFLFMCTKHVAYVLVTFRKVFRFQYWDEASTDIFRRA